MGILFPACVDSGRVPQSSKKVLYTAQQTARNARGNATLRWYATGGAFAYDGDGNRVEKVAGGVTTKYLVSEVNPTGYAQVLEEVITTSAAREQREFVYGLERISQVRFYSANNQAQTQKSYYVYDGHGSVRALADPNGNITDTYDYDAYGNLTHSTYPGTPPGSTSPAPTPNEFLFAGEQYDSNLSLYYNRARYLNVTTGRFWTMDTYDGDPQSPLSLHKYLYVEDDPTDHLDQSGNQIDDVVASFAVSDTLQAIAVVSAFALVCAVDVELGGNDCTDRFKPKVDLYHYTPLANLSLIIGSGELRPSTGGNAVYGEGQYLTDITPEEASQHRKQDLSEALYVDPDHWGPGEIGFLEIEFDQDAVERKSGVYGTKFPGRGIFLHFSLLPYNLLGTLRDSGAVIFSAP